MKQRTFYIFSYLCLLLFFCFSGNVTGKGFNESDPRAFKLRNFSGKKVLGRNLDYFIDKKGDLDFKDVFQLEGPKWTPSQKSNPNFGFTPYVIWLRFTIDGTGGSFNSQQTYFIEIGNSRLNRVEFYENVNGDYTKRTFGSSLPFSVQEIKYRNPLIEISPSGEVKTYFIKINSTVATTTPVILHTEGTFNEKRNDESLFYGIYFGIMLIMVLYNFVLYINLREQSYLYFVLFIFLYALASFSRIGYASQFIWPDNTFWAQRSALACYILSAAFSLQFARKFLDLRSHHPNTDKVIFWGYITALVFACTYVVVYKPVISFISVILMLVVNFGLLYIGILMTLKKYRPAYYYLIAWAAFLISQITLMLVANGAITANYFTWNASYFSSALEAGLLSLAMGDRMNIMIKEKDRARQKVIDIMKKDKEKEDYLSIVSHDLKSPVNSIRGIIGLMRAGKKKYSEEDRTYMGLIEKICNNLLGMVKRMLDINAFEVDKAISLKPLQLNIELEATLSNFEIDFKNKNLVLNKNIECQDDWVMVDQELLHHIFENLISNAVKYSEKRKSIYISMFSTDSHIRTVFKDEGPGISQEDMKKMFNRYQKLSARPTGGESSTGLGLSIVKKYTDLMNGSIKCESQVGNGSSFILDFPKYAPQLN